MQSFLRKYNFKPRELKITGTKKNIFDLLSIIKKIKKFATIYFKEAHKQLKSLVSVSMMHQSKDVP